MMPVNPKLTIEAEHSCNWKCCLTCCNTVKEEEVPPPAERVTSDDSNERITTVVDRTIEHVVETSTRVHKHSKENK